MLEWPRFAKATQGTAELVDLSRLNDAAVAELVDAHDSKSCIARCESSILSRGTICTGRARLKIVYRKM
jgi:hypothetical protein